MTIHNISSSLNTISKCATWNRKGVTVAGTGFKGNSSRSLDRVFGIAIDNDNNLYVSDHNNHRVQKFTPGSTEGVTVVKHLQHSIHIFVDSEKNLFIADTWNHRIVKLANGEDNCEVVVKSSKTCNGVFVDQRGYIYVSEESRHRVVRYSPNLSLTPKIVAGICDKNGSSSQRLSRPAGIYVTPDGTLYVADRDNHRIQKWSPGATEGVTVAGTGRPGNDTGSLLSPRGIIVDDQGTLYIADTENRRVLRWEPTHNAGTVIASGLKSNQSTTLGFPGALAFDSDGNLYVADVDNHRVQKFFVNNRRCNTTRDGNESDEQIGTVDPLQIERLENIKNSHDKVSQLSKMNPSDFIFDFDKAVTGVSTGDGGHTVAATAANFPGLINHGIAMTIGFLTGCGYNLPHTHPRATEINFSVDGDFQVGFYQENGARFIMNELHKNQAAVFPKGAIHFELNLNCAPATFVAAFNSEDPGVLTIGSAFFGSLPATIVGPSLGGLNISTIDDIRANLVKNPSLGIAECRKRCGL